MTREPDHELRDQVEFGWRVHAAQEAWTAKVDVKASVLLAAQVGLLVAIATITSATGFKQPVGFWWVILPGGVLFLLIGGMLSATAIYPMLFSNESTSNDLIYFGHLKDLQTAEVHKRIMHLSMEDQVRALARQLVAMSKANWRKHRALQWSIRATGLGTLLIVIDLALSF